MSSINLNDKSSILQIRNVVLLAGYQFNADPYQAFHFIAGSDSAPHQSDANQRTLVYRPSRAPFWAATPPLWASMGLHGSILSL